MIYATNNLIIISEFNTKNETSGEGNEINNWNMISKTETEERTAAKQGKGKHEADESKQQHSQEQGQRRTRNRASTSREREGNIEIKQPEGKWKQEVKLTLDEHHTQPSE